MTGRADKLFAQFSTFNAVLSLIGQCEDTHLDCKEWSRREEDNQRMIAKAACGFANADGGVLVIGMRARSSAKDEPDLIEAAAPVDDTSAVKSRILDLVGQLVEPGIEGVQAAEIHETPGSKAGFVLIHIPASSELPRRSRKDWKFHLRIGSGTFPMEYFQIAEMFGRRPHPRLEVYLESTGALQPLPPDPVLYRYFWFGLSNTGRGMAKFPAIRFRTTACPLRAYPYGLDGNGSVGLPLRPSDQEWVTYRGGVDDVLYPGMTLKITRLVQRASSVEERQSLVIFESVNLVCEVSCEGMATFTVEQTIPEFRAQV